MCSDRILEAIHSRRMLLQNQYAFVGDDGNFQADAPAGNESITRAADPALRNRAASKLSHNSIESIARDLQRDIYFEAKRQGNVAPINPISLLDPAIAARHLGIEFVIEPGLGNIRFGQKNIEIAGLIDRRINRISLSRRLNSSTHRFTGAHEIGHWLMHPGEVFHRDRPIDAPSNYLGPRDPIESQADYFAAFFLIPRKIVIRHFVDRFETDTFRFTTEQAFNLSGRRYMELTSGSLDVLSKAKILAEAESYNGQRFVSLADEFGVSKMAMAIQIRDLKLTE